MIAGALTLALLIAACGGDGGTPSGELPQDVHVHLEEWSVAVQPSSFAGPATITFGGHNHGRYPHQVTIIKTDLDLAELPQDRGRVDAEAAGEQVLSFEVPEADGGEGLQVGIADLNPAKYAIICNIPGHYQQGMYASFEVTESAPS